MPTNDGKQSEHIISSLWKAEEKVDKLFMYGRFTDTAEARNFVNAKPSDFYVIYDGKMILVEVKSSMDMDRFPLKNIRPKQYGTARRYALAGVPCIYPIHLIPTNQWFFVPLDLVVSKHESGVKSFKWAEFINFAGLPSYRFWRAFV